MALKANYFKIGIFVVASIVVLIAFTIILGVGSFGSEQIRFETYIDESVHGLLVGSPVKRRGVQIGTVENITFLNNHYNLGDKRREFSRYVMVVIAASAEDIASYRNRDSFYSMLDELIEDGLRIRLTTQALTGIAYLEVDYFDPNAHPPIEPFWQPKYKYIPSTTSVLGSFTQSLEQTLKKVEQVPFVEITQKLNSLLENLNSTIEQTRVTDISENTLELISELRKTNSDLQEVISDAKIAIEQANVKTLSDKAQGLMDNIDSSVTDITDLVKTDVSRLLESVDQTNGLVQNMLQDSSSERTTIPALTASIDDLVVEIRNVVDENRDELQSVAGKLDHISTNLMDFSSTLKQNPSAIIFSEPPAASEVVK